MAELGFKRTFNIVVKSTYSGAKCTLFIKEWVKGNSRFLCGPGVCVLNCYVKSPLSVSPVNKATIV